MTDKQSNAISRFRNLEAEWCRIAMLLDLAETKAAAVSGKRAWSDETDLAYQTATIEHRRV